ncbi:SDR family NAD(P)-dependent oxidoreductase [Solihabitans fulvus]|uniref:SDR family NAD(P)-dependent oxidoreductase n=1 Tax=Solihabitans fulvus TaxID=1892852 RepID=A0A5B2XC71_9PSEU|nr:SDR family NAD(P)-dependent oxidoreductase [Solihabitans fulvus]KAA2261308.1 SDR family NAD(P)-dependent oxidoreductase [Solihabitans fulvus]
MSTCFVTGATGFIGRHLVARLLARPDCERVYVLVRSQSRERLAAITARWPEQRKVVPVVGDLTAPALGVDLGELAGAVDHVLHLGAVYDLTRDLDSHRAANVDGTRNVIDFAGAVGARWLHHVSSIAVAGAHRGRFAETDFDLGQRLPTPYHQTKFAAEKLVREQDVVPWRVYRPSAVVGDSRTGEMDKIDGPYYFFPAIALLAGLPVAPAWLPLVAPDLGATNLVPVDHVAAAIDHLMHAEAPSGSTFHLTNAEPQSITEVYNALAEAAGAPRVALTAPGWLSAPARAAVAALARTSADDPVRAAVLTELGVPPEVLPHLTLPTTFDNAATRAALAGTGIEPPPLREYAGALWRYWADHLDQDRAGRRRSARGELGHVPRISFLLRGAQAPPRRVAPTPPSNTGMGTRARLARRHLDPRSRRKRPTGHDLAGRRVLITGASSGIGRATALAVARHGAVPLLVARRAEELDKVVAEIVAAGGAAVSYPCDLTDGEAVDALLKQVLAEHAGVDMVVNNAGRSIRRSVLLSVDRLHDYERTMALNYFAPLRLILGLLPHMAERRFGHIVNVSTMGVQTNTPRFSAYLGSKAALDAFSRVAAGETVGDGVTFTSVRMPLVRTPMSGATKVYDAFPAATPERAADLVVRALVERPEEVNLRSGVLADLARRVAPRTGRAVAHLAYRALPESAPEARGRQAAVPPLASVAAGLTRLLRNAVR